MEVCEGIPDIDDDEANASDNEDDEIDDQDLADLIDYDGPDDSDSESTEIARWRPLKRPSSGPNPPKKRRRCAFIDDEADASDDDDDDIDDQDLTNLIDDAELEDEHFHRELDQEHNMNEFLAEPVVPVAPTVDPSFPVNQKPGVIFPLRVVDRVLTHHVNLLLTEKNGDSHYSTIRNFSRLVRSQVTRHQHKHFFCYRCLHGFQQQDLLDEHMKLCKNVTAQRIKMPSEKEKILKFKNIAKQLRAPFVVYADFECLLKEVDVVTSPVGISTASVSNTVKYQEHVPCSYAYKVISDVPEYQPNLKISDISANAAKGFLQDIQEVADHIITEYILKQKPKPRRNQLSAEERRRFFTDDCHICGEAFPTGHNVPLQKRRVLDHDHLVSEPGKGYGKFRGPAHNHCNLQYRIMPESYKLPVVIHNLRGYDSHLIIKALEKANGKIRVIPNNMEKYMSLSVGQVQFIDSLQFTNSGLDKLVKTLHPTELKVTQKQFPDPAEFELVKQKGIYPYDHFNSLDRFNETQLPDQDRFTNKLTGKKISDDEYDRACRVWATFNCHTLQKYHDVYLQTDVTLLADVFEKFRDTCINAYQLDPCHYLSAPGLAFDAALKHTKIELELLTDIDMHLFIENSIRGGVSMISTRYAKANHSLLPSFDPAKELEHLIYLDANNLYGWAMSQALPTGKFRWLPVKHMEQQFPVESFKERLARIPHNARLGYIFQVDLRYPHHLHDQHTDYPLVPEHFSITPDMYSPFMKEHFAATSSKKLTPNLNDKTLYTVHYRNLQLYLDLGMEVTKIHRVLEFEQQPWLASYIDLNTEMRSRATSEFEKDFFKLMNNAVFGKTMENVRGRISIDLIMDAQQLKKRVAKPTFKRGQAIREDLHAIECYNTTVTLNKPIYCGFSILELSKTLMYAFHYQHMKQKYPGDRLKLLFTDTDSLAYAVKTTDIYEDMAQDALEKYDFSEYPEGHKLLDDFNKKAIGYFKDELNSIPLEEFAGLRPKSYSLKFTGTVKNNTFNHHDPQEKATAAGVKKSVKESDLRHQQYIDCLRLLKPQYVTQNTIVSKKHTLYSINQTRIGLSAVDTKRYILNDGVHTLAHGHWRIAAGQAEYTSYT